MGDAKEGEEERPRCVGCGRRVKTLYMQYSPGNIRLMKCVREGLVLLIGHV
jgi:hypothetical protein